MMLQMIVFYILYIAIMLVFGITTPNWLLYGTFGEREYWNFFVASVTLMTFLLVFHYIKSRCEKGLTRLVTSLLLNVLTFITFLYILTLGSLGGMGSHHIFQYGESTIQVRTIMNLVILLALLITILKMLSAVIEYIKTQRKETKRYRRDIRFYR